MRDPSQLYRVFITSSTTLTLDKFRLFFSPMTFCASLPSACDVSLVKSLLRYLLFLEIFEFSAIRLYFKSFDNQNLTSRLSQLSSYTSPALPITLLKFSPLLISLLTFFSYFSLLQATEIRFSSQ